MSASFLACFARFSRIFRSLTTDQGITRSLALFATLLLCAAAEAQVQVAIRGEVTDANTSRVLPSAEVQLLEIGRTVTTATGGQYAFNNVPAGNYTLRVTTLGYQPVEQTVTVPASGTATANVGLVAVGLTEEIVVTGYRASQANALQDKRMSAMIKETLTADDAGKLPDHNVAEALRRVTGVTATVDQGEGRYVTVRGIDPSYSSVTLNNQVIGSPEDTRRVALDTIPSEVMSRIEVVKSVTPDMDGNSVGGAINIVTPSAFDDPDGHFFSATADFGYYDLNGKNPFGLSAAWGQTFGAEDHWGVLLSASYTDRNFDSENLQGGDPWEDEDGFLIPDEQVLRDYRIERVRSGLVANLEYKPSDSATLYFRNLLNFYEDTESQAETIWAYREGDLENQTATSGTFTEGEGEKLISDRLEKQSITTSSLGGEFLFNQWTLDASVTFGKAEQDTPRDREWSFELADPLAMDYDTSNFFWMVTAQDEAAFETPGNYEFNEYLRGGQIIVEDLLALQLDLERDISVAGHQGFVKFGLKQIDREKTSDQNMDVFDGYEDDFTADGFTEPGKSDFYDSAASGYEFGPRLLYDALESFYSANSAGFELSDGDTVAESYGVDFEVDETISSAYVMGELEIGRATLVGGLRVEMTESDYSAYDLIFLDGDPAAPVPTTGSNDYDHWLPSLQMRMALNENLLLRAAWTNTIGRPSYEFLPPFRIFEIDEDDPGVFEGEAEAGNPNLVPLESMNLDLALEWYLESGGILAAGMFYKDIDKPIFTRITVLEDEVFEGRFFSELELSTTENADSGEIFGLEFNYQQQLLFLPSPFNGFGISLNYTYTDSEATIFDRVDPVPFFLQSEHIGNAALYYERSGFEARLAYTYYSTYLDEVGDDASQDYYADDRGQLDFKASYQFTDNINAFVEVLNMTDEPLRFISGRKSGRLAENEIYGWNTLAGLQIKF
jgi:TonB-dependent receptor